jgi:hypothetical protein
VRRPTPETAPPVLVEVPHHRAAPSGKLLVIRRPQGVLEDRDRGILEQVSCRLGVTRHLLREPVEGPLVKRQLRLSLVEIHASLAE